MGRRHRRVARGVGGVLIHRVSQSWHILEVYEAPVQAHQATTLDIEHLQTSGQAVLEGLAILRSQIWRVSSGDPL